MTGALSVMIWLADLEDAANGYVGGAPPDVCNDAQESAEKIRKLLTSHVVVERVALEQLLVRVQRNEVTDLYAALEELIAKG